MRSVAQSCPTLCSPKEPSRLLCPWNFPGKNTGVGCHFFLQGICPTQGSSLHLLCLLHCWQVSTMESHGRSKCFTHVSLINSHNNPKRCDQELRLRMTVTQLVPSGAGVHTQACAIMHWLSEAQTRSGWSEGRGEIKWGAGLWNLK